MAKSRHWHSERSKQKRERLLTKESYIKKGTQNSFEHQLFLVGWIDLLGYGSMLRECYFDVTSNRAQEATKRLVYFHTVLQAHADIRLPILQMNDGAIAWRQLSFRTTSVTLDFLKRSINLFEAVNKADIDLGYYGARMVLSVGTYTTIQNNRDRKIRTTRSKLLIDQVKNGEKTIDEAIHEACFHRGFFNVIPELQANYAFTKAYIAESSGRKNGFSGNRLFIDCNIFEEMVPDWLEFDNRLYWEYPGLSGYFIQYKGLNLKTANKSKGAGIRSTESIANILLENAKDKKDVLLRFRGNKREMIRVQDDNGE